VSELDLLRWTGHGYFAGDTKSGAGEEGRGGGPDGQHSLDSNAGGNLRD
jgi:hypothetical protein